MELFFDDDKSVPPDIKVKYRKAFEIISKALGVDMLPNKVKLLFDIKRPDVELTYRGMIVNSVMGATQPRNRRGNLKIWVNLYRSSCNCSGCSKINEQSPLKVFCHEMVHAAQEASSRLTNLGKKEGASQKIEFDGVVYGTEDNPIPVYENMPWEKEAEGLTEHLYDLVRSLDVDKREIYYAPKGEP